MDTIPRICEAMQRVLTRKAEALGRATGFVRRASKVSGSILAKTLVFGWLKNPKASLGELTQTTAALGVRVSPQGLEQRLGQAAARLLKAVLDEGVNQLVATEPVAVSVLQRFNGVYLLDSSTVVLPDALGTVWPGCGGSSPVGTAASVKLQAAVDLCTGALVGPLLVEGKAQDRNSALQNGVLPPGAMRIADLGYFSIQRLAELSNAGAYWLSRVQVGTGVVDGQNRSWELGALLAVQGDASIDLKVFLGIEQRLPCRLLAVRVPPEVAQERRRRLRYDASRKRQAVSEARLRLAEWTVYATNAPQELLSIQEALVLGRARWQIELLFKLWKNQGQIDSWRSAKPWRILCEVYAKLLAMLVQHWITLAACWRYPGRSLTKAAQTVRSFAIMLATAMAGLLPLSRVVRRIVTCLVAGCRINPRRKHPNTYQLLLQFNSSA